MTMHTKAATDEIYELFNAPLKSAEDEDADSDEDEYMTDGDYTSDAESTGTTRQIPTSEAGDDETSDEKSESEWSEFTARKHIPDIDDDDENEIEAEEQDHTRASELPDDVQMTDNEDDEDEDRDDELSPPRTRFIPLPPEDYNPPIRPYRDPAEVANNRLPFMTPITERTEMSLGITTVKSHFLGGKTPSRDDLLDTPTEDEEEDDEDFEPLSSPLREILSEARETRSPIKIAQPLLQKLAPAVSKPAPAKTVIPKGPIIKDTQCNPVDTAVREEILANMHPPLTSYANFYDHRSERFERGSEIRKFMKAMAKSSKNGNEKTGTIHTPIVVEFPELMCEYTIKRELGAGAFAPVYLVENSSPESEEGAVEEGQEQQPLIAMGKGAFATTHRRPFEALKMEQPPTAWEFHMMRLAATRLGPQHRATASISAALEMHLYQDDGFLFLPYHPHGTILDVVNHFRAAEPSQVMDEPLAMFFAVELLRTVEALHSKQILHGDIKPDNCLLRLDPLPAATTPGSPTESGCQQQQLSAQWQPDGSGGWASRGVVLIDFGRGIDMRAFAPGCQFVADWKTTTQDCAEAREGRPWTWQIDYHGLAGVVHCLLFGRYIDTVRADSGIAVAGARRYKIRESLKRYWQTDIWSDCFDLLLNPASHVEGEDGRALPVNRGLRRVRERMEGWLVANSERGVGLRAMVARVEAFAKGRK